MDRSPHVPQKSASGKRRSLPNTSLRGHAVSVTHRGTDSPLIVYWLEENNWLPRPIKDCGTQRRRDGRRARTHALPRNSPPARWRVSCQLWEQRFRPELGRRSPPTTSPTSTTTSTAHRKRSEAGLRGHALLGCSTSSTRSVPCAGNPCPEGAW